MVNEINIEKLRKDLIDYFGTAMFNASPFAIMNLTEVENANSDKLIQIALKNNFNLEDYIENNNYRKNM